MTTEVPIQITGRHLEITDAIREAVTKKFHKLERHFPHITRIHVTLSVDNIDRREIKKTDRPQNHKAKALISLPNKHEIVAEESTDDLYASIDGLVATLDRQLIKTNGIMKNRNGGLTSELRHH